ncbi:MAG TPA: iron-containing alcohol dehydrogenase [Steroidobacteraceae bacterium]|nr:iron-containing alcohol dehydrogenase [Steroidobacteraceae bacterium]
MYRTMIGLTALERVHSGRPVAEALAEEAERLGAKRVFLVCSHTLNTQTDEIEKVRKALGSKLVGVFDRVRPHVPREDVSAATVAAGQVSPDMLASIGGGSATDLTKILAICLKHGLRTPESMEPYHLVVNADHSVTAPVFEGPDLPVVIAPTTLSGGEFNALSGATDKVSNVKQGYMHPSMTAKAVILDPSLTVHTPEWIWLSTGVRSFDHAFETLGSLGSNDYYDGMAMNAVRLLSQGLPRVKANTADLEARQMCQMGAWCSMVSIVCGLPMGISHAIGHALGGSFNVPHGYTSCVMAPFALEYNRPVNGERQQLISIAFGQPNRPAHDLADEAIRGLGMPRSLTAVGLKEADLAPLAGYTFQDIWCGTNPRPIANPDELVPLLRKAL